MATGPFNLVCVPEVPDDDYGMCRGWVFSYHEFAEPDLTRLTDEEWRERVEAGEHRSSRPEWVESYMYEP